MPFTTILKEDYERKIPRSCSDDEHLLAATAIYQMWKSHQNSGPVRVVLLELGGKRYITIDDLEGAQSLLTLSAD